MAERLVVITNPNATGADRVESEVLNPLDYENITYDTFTTKSDDFSDNVNMIGDFIRDGDRIIVAAGDGTVSQVSNAIVRRKVKNVEVAALPYGGFVDLATKSAKVLDVVDDNVDIYRRYPLAIHLDDDKYPERYADAYLGLGQLALIANSFASEKSRQNLRGRKGLSKRALQVAQLGNQYFKQKLFIPKHSTGLSGLVHNAVTDYMLVNNNRAGGIMGFSQDFGKEEEIFGVIQRDISKIIPNIPFGLMSLAGKTPSTEQSVFSIKFDDTSSVPMHNDGEFLILNEVNQLNVQKNPDDFYLSVRPGRNRD